MFSFLTFQLLHFERFVLPHGCRMHCFCQLRNRRQTRNRPSSRGLRENRGMAWRLLNSSDMKVAIPHWQGRISPLFDAAGTLLLIDIEEGREVKRDNFKLSRRDPLRRAQEVSRLGADMLLCGAVSRELENALLGAGVRVVGFICGDLEGVIAAFLGGTLSHSRFHMPGWENNRPGAVRPGRAKRRGKRPPDQRGAGKR